MRARRIEYDASKDHFDLVVKHKSLKVSLELKHEGGTTWAKHAASLRARESE